MSAALTLANLPEDLLNRLQEAAQQHGCSIEQEVESCLRKAVL